MRCIGNIETSPWSEILRKMCQLTYTNALSLADMKEPLCTKTNSALFQVKSLTSCFLKTSPKRTCVCVCVTATCPWLLTACWFVQSAHIRKKKSRVVSVCLINIII